MKRFAAHYVFSNRALPLHYIEFHAGILREIYPLVEEISGTAFFDGILLPVPSSVGKVDIDKALSSLSEAGVPLSWEHLSSLLPLGDWAGQLAGCPARLFLLDPQKYSSSELRADD